MSITWRRTAAPTAVGLGPAIIIFAVMRNWHGWEAAPFWMDDVVAGVLLTGAGVYALKNQDSLRGRVLSAAFALAVGVLWASLFETMAGLHPAPEQWSALPSVSLLATLTGFVIAAAGLIFSLPSKRPPFIGTRPEPVKATKKKGRR